ncbi:hypothetical protein C8R46DRAFT_1042111 [Mycena filopes]|nr:hypothetical protein C8R46DRAFT_1042111 [Mycena filopes]
MAPHSMLDESLAVEVRDGKEEHASYTKPLVPTILPIIPHIERLSAELLGEIFIHLLPWGSPLTLSWVCRRWRTISLGIARLWTRPRFILGSTFFPTLSMGHGSRNCHRWRELPILDAVIRPYAHSLQLLDLETTEGQLSALLDGLSEFPCLTSLSIHLPFLGLSDWPWHQGITQSAPSLQSLVISADAVAQGFGGFMSCFPWHQLVTLDLLQVALEAHIWYDILRQCSILLNGSFTIRASSTHSIEQAIAVHQLTSLNIRLQTEFRLQFFDVNVLQYAFFPALETLHVTARVDCENSLPFLLWFQRHCGLLRVLTLNVTLTDNLLLDSLRSLRYLERLTLSVPYGGVPHSKTLFNALRHGCLEKLHALTIFSEMYPDYAPEGTSSRSLIHRGAMLDLVRVATTWVALGPERDWEFQLIADAVLICEVRAALLGVDRTLIATLTAAGALNISGEQNRVGIQRLSIRRSSKGIEVKEEPDVLVELSKFYYLDAVARPVFTSASGSISQGSLRINDRSQFKSQSGGAMPRRTSPSSSLPALRSVGLAVRKSGTSGGCKSVGIDEILGGGRRASVTGHRQVVSHRAGIRRTKRTPETLAQSSDAGKGKKGNSHGLAGMQLAHERGGFAAAAAAAAAADIDADEAPATRSPGVIGKVEALRYVSGAYRHAVLVEAPWSLRACPARVRKTADGRSWGQPRRLVVGYTGITISGGQEEAARHTRQLERDTRGGFAAVAAAVAVDIDAEPPATRSSGVIEALRYRRREEGGARHTRVIDNFKETRQLLWRKNEGIKVEVVHTDEALQYSSRPCIVLARACPARTRVTAGGHSWRQPRRLVVGRTGIKISGGERREGLDIPE